MSLFCCWFLSSMLSSSDSILFNSWVEDCLSCSLLWYFYVSRSICYRYWASFRFNLFYCVLTVSFSSSKDSFCSFSSSCNCRYSCYFFCIFRVRSWCLASWLVILLFSFSSLSFRSLISAFAYLSRITSILFFAFSFFNSNAKEFSYFFCIKSSYLLLTS